MSTEPFDPNRCDYRVGEIDRRSLIPLLGAEAVFLLAGQAEAQQVPIPTTAAQVPGPPTATAMTTAYVQTVGRMAYLWGWPLVNNVNRSKAFAEATEPGLLGGVVPVAFNRNAMLTSYIKPDQNFVTCTNQDVVYGTGYMALDKEPIVFQVPDFGDSFLGLRALRCAHRLGSPMHSAGLPAVAVSRSGSSTPMMKRCCLKRRALPS